MDIQQVIDGINKAIANPRIGRKWVRDFIRKLTPEDLKRAVEQDYDPVTDAIERFRLYDPQVRPLAQVLLRMYWDTIQRELRSVPRIIERLSENPANREVLKDKRVIEWLNLTCQRAYNVFYEYAFPPNINLKCAYCGSVFQYDVSLCTGMDFNAKAGNMLHIVVCPNCGKEVKALF